VVALDLWTVGGVHHTDQAVLVVNIPRCQGPEVLGAERSLRCSYDGEANQGLES